MLRILTAVAKRFSRRAVDGSSEVIRGHYYSRFVKNYFRGKDVRLEH